MVAGGEDSMHRQCLTLAFMCCVVFPSCARQRDSGTGVQSGAAGKVVEIINIPLEQVWAYEMAGTRDVTRLEPQLFTRQFHELPTEQILNRSRSALVRQFLNALNDPPARGAQRGFAVQGSGAGALRNAHAVLVGDKSAQQEFLAGSDITLVFFSYSASSAVQLQSVKRVGNQFEILYEFLPHMEANMSSHFALIPAGDLPAATYQVAVRLASADGVQELDGKRLACRSYSFYVSSSPQGRSTP